MWRLKIVLGEQWCVPLLDWMKSCWRWILEQGGLGVGLAIDMRSWSDGDFALRFGHRRRDGFEFLYLRLILYILVGLSLALMVGARYFVCYGGQVAECG